ncbi:MAG: UbiA family prenyltransferase [Polyangia bacterium]
MFSFLRCARHFLRRRLVDLLVLQGAPLLGLLLAEPDWGLDTAVRAAWLLLTSLLLVAQVFSFNDWADRGLDARSADKADGVFTTAEITPAQMLVFSAVLGALGLASAVPLLGPRSLIALGVLFAGFLYSHPAASGKGRPFISSALHFAGQVLQFLLGYAVVSAVDPRGVAVGVYFGLVFVAGHLTQEARDHAGDREAGVRTHAVVFGPRKALWASFVLFTCSFVWLALLGVLELLPRGAIWLCLAYPIYLAVFVAAVLRGPGFASLSRLQLGYRAVFAAIGLGMLAILLLDRLRPW